MRYRIYAKIAEIYRLITTIKASIRFKSFIWWWYLITKWHNLLQLKMKVSHHHTFRRSNFHTKKSHNLFSLQTSIAVQQKHSSSTLVIKCSVWYHIDHLFFLLPQYWAKNTKTFQFQTSEYSLKKNINTRYLQFHSRIFREWLRQSIATED